MYRIFLLERMVPVHRISLCISNSQKIFISCYSITFLIAKNMSFNVASSSGATSNLPTAEQVKEWSRDDVKTFLQGNITRLDLEGEDIDKIYTQRVKGSTFLDLT